MSVIKAHRILITGDKPFEKVDLFDFEEQKTRGLPNFFERFQFAFRAQGHTYIIPSYQITYIWLRKGKMRPNPEAVPIRRLTIDGQIVHSPAYVIDQDLYKKMGLPELFDAPEQFAFYGNDGLYISSDYKVQLVEYR